MTDLKQFDFDQMVSEKEGKPVTTSLKVAEYFGKTHGKVLRAIKKLKCSKKFTEANFGLSGYIDSTGRKLPMYTMTKDGFIFLVMGFTGEKAAQVKEAYIDAFNWMYDQLTNISKSYMEMLNKAMLQFKQEQSIASYAGRTLRHWQDSKPILESKINEIASKAQLRLEM